MAKSIRSKIKRKHRTEFRQTIGEDAAKKQMEVTQAKLQECVQSGNNVFDSIQKLSEQFYGGDDESGDVINADVAMSEGKSEDKIPIKHRQNNVRKAYRKKKAIAAIPGSDAARMARKTVNRAKRRGQMKHGNIVAKKIVTKERAPRKNRMAMST